MRIGGGIHHGAAQNGKIFSRFEIDEAVCLSYWVVIISRELKNVWDVVLVAMMSL